MSRPKRKATGGRCAGRGVGRAKHPKPGLAVGNSPAAPSSPAPAATLSASSRKHLDDAHRWLGRRLRVCKVSENGHRRYFNACVVYYDPTESHPFHCLHEDGNTTWVAIRDEDATVSSIDPRTRRRVSRQFTWLTPERVRAGEWDPSSNVLPNAGG